MINSQIDSSRYQSFGEELRLLPILFLAWLSCFRMHSRALVSLVSQLVNHDLWPESTHLHDYSVSSSAGLSNIDASIFDKLHTPSHRKNLTRKDLGEREAVEARGESSCPTCPANVRIRGSRYGADSSRERKVGDCEVKGPRGWQFIRTPRQTVRSPHQSRSNIGWS